MPAGGEVGMSGLMVERPWIARRSPTMRSRRRRGSTRPEAWLLCRSTKRPTTPNRKARWLHRRHPLHLGFGWLRWRSGLRFENKTVAPAAPHRGMRVDHGPTMPKGCASVAGTTANLRAELGKARKGIPQRRLPGAKPDAPVHVQSFEADCRGTHRIAVTKLAQRGIEADFGLEHAKAFLRSLHFDVWASQN